MIKYSPMRIDLTVRRNQIIVGGGVAILIMIIVAALLFAVIPRGGDSNPATPPVVKVGDTELSEQEYKRVVTQAKDQSVPEQQAKEVIEESIRVQEVARRLNIAVPGYLIAAQNTFAPGYIPYDALTEYERIALYPKAFFVAVALTQSGGSVATIYHAPYDTASNGEDNKKYAESLVARVKSYKDDRIMDEHGKTLNDKLHVLVGGFTLDERSNYKQGVNLSGVIALDDSGQSIVATDAQYVSIDELPVKRQEYDTNVTKLVYDTKEGTLSGVVSMSSPSPSFMSVYRDKVYAKDADIMTKLRTTLQSVGGK